MTARHNSSPKSGSATCLLISDYGKGVCTRSLLQILGDRARHAGVPILVDPARSRNWFGYGQVALIKANWVEATEGARGDHRHPLALARHLVEQYNCHTIVTLGRHGMVAAEREGGAWYLPAEATEVRDVCGAGDTVLAAFGLALSEGRSLHDAGRCALNAASHQVESLGIVAVPFVACPAPTPGVLPYLTRHTNLLSFPHFFLSGPNHCGHADRAALRQSFAVSRRPFSLSRYPIWISALASGVNRVINTD